MTNGASPRFTKYSLTFLLNTHAPLFDVRDKMPKITLTLLLIVILVFFFLLFYLIMICHARKYVDFVYCENTAITVDSLLQFFFCGKIETEVERQAKKSKQAIDQNIVLNYSQNKIVVELYPLSGFINCFIILSGDKNALLFRFAFCCCWFFGMFGIQADRLW